MIILKKNNKTNFSLVENHHRVQEAYSKENWGDLVNFLGGYINFGFWEDRKDFSRHFISDQERIDASLNLYKLVISQLLLSEKERVLEIGCGRGMGLRWLKNFYPANQFIGVDLTYEQCVKSLLFSKAGIICSPAESLPLAKNSIDKLYSVEVLQHAISLERVVEQMRYVLKSSGKLAVTTYFSVNEANYNDANESIELMKRRLDNPVPVDFFIKLLKKYGFRKIISQSIGRRVFSGYNRWINQKQVKTGCSYDYYNAYQAGLIDYYLICAEL